MNLKTDMRHCSFFTPYSEERDNMYENVIALYIF